MRNLGPKSWEMLASAGIAGAEQLRMLGAVPAFVAVERTGCHPSLNLLWAIEGALTDRDWKQIAREERTSLLLQLDDSRRGTKDCTAPG